jgi:hypothetical protein
MTIERFQFAAQRDRDDYVAAVNAAELAKRQAYEMASMSPHIRPEHHAACITQTMVGKAGALECDTPPKYLASLDRKPTAAVARISVVLDDVGGETKTPIVSDPRDAAEVAEVGK